MQDDYPMMLSVYQLVNGKKKLVITVEQRELYRKNKWPARPKIQRALQAL
jgi:hypothetical protein